MGCTPSLKSTKQDSNETSLTPLAQSAIKIQWPVEAPAQKDKASSLSATQALEKDWKPDEQTKDEHLAERYLKIQLLKESKRFMNLSIQTSNYVNNALLALSSNPLLYDPSYPKLIGANKKMLVQKQNRFNYLSRREEKAETELRKQKELCLHKARSQYFRGAPRLQKAKDRHFKHCKQNRSEANLLLLSKQRFSQKMQKIEEVILGSQLTIQ